jgi:ABC-type phosphate/phosphonate transport system substrate-binding protein
MNLLADVGRRIVGAASQPRFAPVATGRSLLQAVAIGAMAVLSVYSAESQRTFLFLKTGEKFATQETAGPTVAAFTHYLGAYEPQVMNDPAKAVEFCTTKKPPLGIVTPGFYLTYAKALGIEPLLEVRRQKVPAEQYVLVVKKSAPDDLAALKGKTIATTLGAEQRYVIGVVLKDKLGEEVRLKPITDVEGAVFDLVEGAKNAADAVLAEDAAWKLFEKDEELGPKLKVAFSSDELPRDLVVLFRHNADGVDVEKVKSVLKDMGNNDAGKQILNSIRVEAFVDIDKDQLSKAQALFYAK